MLFDVSTEDDIREAVHRLRNRIDVREKAFAAKEAKALAAGDTVRAAKLRERADKALAKMRQSTIRGLGTLDDVPRIGQHLEVQDGKRVDLIDPRRLFDLSDLRDVYHRFYRDVGTLRPMIPMVGPGAISVFDLEAYVDRAHRPDTPQRRRWLLSLYCTAESAFQEGLAIRRQREEEKREKARKQAEAQRRSRARR